MNPKPAAYQLPLFSLQGGLTNTIKEPWTRERYLLEFKSLTAKMLEITTKKNNDYGGTSDPFKNFRSFEELGILVRM